MVVLVMRVRHVRYNTLSHVVVVLDNVIHCRRHHSHSRHVGMCVTYVSCVAMWLSQKAVRPSPPVRRAPRAAPSRRICVKTSGQRASTLLRRNNAGATPLQCYVPAPKSWGPLTDPSPCQRHAERRVTSRGCPMPPPHAP
eukprot:scaffold110713_cov63-Phaeocystis_antarctica.AAC.4